MMSRSLRPQKLVRERKYRIGQCFGIIFLFCITSLLIVQCFLMLKILTYSTRSEFGDVSDSLNVKNDEMCDNIVSKENQDLFIKTIKSNVQIKGAAKNNNTRKRIAILTQPGLIGSEFHKAINDVFPDDKVKDYELVHTSHAPPYGYGKNHGFYKIVRLVTLPLELAVQDASLVFENQKDALPSEDFISISKQFIRWHCRLSHVSAHTPLYTVLVPKLIEDPSGIVSNTISFILRDGENSNIDNKFESRIELNRDFFRLRKEQKMVCDKEEVNNAFKEEFDLTNNLKDWPCLALWDTVATKDKQDRLSLSALVASSMVPNCSLPYSSCFVHRDKCEHEGKSCA